MRPRPGRGQTRLIDQPVRRLPTAIARDMTEAEFQAEVVKLAKIQGFLVCHVYPAQNSAGVWVTPTTYKGFPDLTLVKRGRLIFLELKKVGGKATPEQRRWIATAQTVPGVEAWVVDPTDWPEVHAALTRRALDT